MTTDYTRVLSADYKTEESTIQWCICSATIRLGAASVAFFTAQALNAGTGAALMEVRVRVDHWNSAEERFSGEYAGDPAGRARVYVDLFGNRFEFSVHAEGIYADEPRLEPARFVKRSYLTAHHNEDNDNAHV